jgi:metallo-beta-lactamase class B
MQPHTLALRQQHTCPSVTMNVHTALAVLAALLGFTHVCPAAEPTPRSLWAQPQTPFRIFGNTYYVGTKGISVVLIASDAGHVLIDGGLPESARHVADSVRALGFKIEDVKAILNSHAHSDHAGAIAALQKLSSATVFSSPEGAAALAQGHGSQNDPQFEFNDSFPPVASTKVVNDGQLVRVGSLEVVVHYTPGHTPGGTSLSWESCEEDRCFNLVYADSLNAVSDDSFKYSGDPRYPNALEDFRRTLSKVESLPCDILISAHPEFSELWERVDARNAGGEDALIDPSMCRRYVAAARSRLEKRIASERN